MLSLIPSLNAPEDSLARVSFTNKLQRWGEASGEGVCVCMCVRERDGELQIFSSLRTEHRMSLKTLVYLGFFIYLKKKINAFSSREKGLGSAGSEAAVSTHRPAPRLLRQPLVEAGPQTCGHNLCHPEAGFSLPLNSSPCLMEYRGTRPGTTWFCLGLLVASECRTHGASCETNRKRLVRRNGGDAGL